MRNSPYSDGFLIPDKTGYKPLIMKNNILLLALFALLTTAFAQNSLTSKTVGTVKTSASVVTLQTPKHKSPETKAMETIERSKFENTLLGINDPNKIQIGNTLAFRLENGGIVYHDVTAGDNQYSVLVKFFTEHPNDELAGVSSEPTSQPLQSNVQPNSLQIKRYPILDFWAMPLGGIPVIVWMALLVIGSFFLYQLYKKWQSEKAARLEKESIENDPTLAGPPVYGNGIEDANATEVMVNAVKTVHPDLALFPIKILKMEKGTINATAAEVFFGGKLSKKGMVVNNVRGVRATVIIGEEVEEKIVYALQACGNPLKDGNYVAGQQIQFTPDTLGAEIVLPVPVQPTAEIVVEPTSSTQIQAQGLFNAIEALKESGNGSIQYIVLPNGKTHLSIIFTRLALPPHVPAEAVEAKN